MLTVLSNEPLVVIVIVNYNGSNDTSECLESLQEIAYENYKIVVVDNASVIDPIPELKKKFPSVDYIRSEKNLGFTGGNNLGLEKAYEYEPRYIFLLNNDTVVSKNILSDCVGFMEAHPHMGMIGPVNYYYETKDTISFAGGYLNRNNGMVEFLYKKMKLSSVNKKVVPCSFIEGSALFIRTDLIKQIGGFYNDYFLTSEESELCVKVEDLGYQLAVITSCSVWHKVSQSMEAESELANYFIFRNKLWFIKRNAVKTTLRDSLQLFRYIVICLLSFTIKKRNFPAAKGIIEGIIDFINGVKGAGRFKEMLNA